VPLFFLSRTQAVQPQGSFIMELVIIIACVGIGAAAYFFALRPLFRMFFVPLTSRIPTGREYRPSLRVRS
jgi:hypothetical protein